MLTTKHSIGVLLFDTTSPVIMKKNKKNSKRKLHCHKTKSQHLCH